MQPFPSLEGEKFLQIFRTRPSVLGQSYYILVAANFGGPSHFEGRTLVLSPTGGIEDPLIDFMFQHDNEESIEIIFGQDAFINSMIESAKMQLLGHFWDLIESEKASKKVMESPDLFEELLDHKTALSTIIFREDSSFRPMLTEFANRILDSSIQTDIEKLISASKHYSVTRKPWTLAPPKPE